MTIREAINRADTVKPNQYSDEMKIQWLEELDKRIYNDLYLTHEDNPFDTIEGEGIVFPYDDEAILLAPSPYDVLYVSYIKAKIDEYNEETTRYVNSCTTYNSQYQDYARWYNRTHMPIQIRR